MIRIKKPSEVSFKGFLSSGGRTRTYDLRVMSPTSYQLLHSAIVDGKYRVVRGIPPN